MSITGELCVGFVNGCYLLCCLPSGKLGVSQECGTDGSMELQPEMKGEEIKFTWKKHFGYKELLPQQLTTGG